MAGPPFRAAVISPPEQHDLLAESVDPATCNVGFALTGGSIYVVRLYVPKSGVATKIAIVLSSAGAVLTAGQNFAALLDDDGVKLAETADQAIAWQSSGEKQMAIPSQQLIAGNFYRIALLANGTTPPSLRASSTSGTASNIALSADEIRFGIAATGQTAIPDPVDLSAPTVTQSILATLK
jgi:hypothetical protein